MKSIDKIYNIFINNFHDQKVTTIEVAKAAGLSRGVVSSYLSSLYSQGKVTKTHSRPVFWQIVKPKSSFDELIGAKGSLADVIIHCKESLSYPDNDLPLIITGNNGTGKKLLAQKMYEEALTRKVITKTDPFIKINASDYVSNQRNFIKLFQKSKKCSKFDNILSTKSLFPNNKGILFIHEAQKLSQNNQQLLLNLIKSAIRDIKCQVRFIISITGFEDCLLLNKKIGLQIKLPDFLDRYFFERLSLVLNFFYLEAQKIKHPIIINTKIVKQLTMYDHPDNIAALENKIKLLLAKSYVNLLPKEEIYIGLPNKLNIKISSSQNDLNIELSNLINSFMQLKPSVSRIMDDLIHSIKLDQQLSEQNFIVMKLLHLINISESPKTLDLINDHLKIKIQTELTEKYGLSLPENKDFWNRCSLCTAFIVIYNKSSIFRENNTIKNTLQNKYPRSIYLFEKIFEDLFKTSKLNDCHFLLFFILMTPIVNKIEGIKYNCILLAHGQGIASNIQKVVNSLCGNYIFESFDMQLDTSIKQISSSVKQYLEKQNNYVKGTIILFDMGSLSQIFNEIKKYSHKRLIVINNLTTAMALDTGLRVQRNDSFKEIALESQHYGETTGSQYYEGLADHPHIIISCMSGIGLSTEIKDVFKSTLSDQLEIITIDYKELINILKNNNQSFFANTILILTTTNINSDLSLNIMNIYDVFDRDASIKLKKILKESGETQKNVKLLIEQLLHLFSVEGIKTRLQFLNPDIIIEEAQNAVAHYESYYNLSLNSKLKLNLYMHISLMVERMILRKGRYDDPSYTIDNDSKTKEFFSISKDIFKSIQDKFNVKITNFEISLIYQLLKDCLN